MVDVMRDHGIPRVHPPGRLRLVTAWLGAGTTGAVVMACILPITGVAATVRPGDFIVLNNAQLIAVDGGSMAATVVGYVAGASNLAVRGNGDVLLTVPGTGVVRLDLGTGVQAVLTPSSTLGDGALSGITVGPDGSVYVSMQSTPSRVLQLSADGALERVVTSGGFLPLPAGMCFGYDGSLYVCATSLYGGGGLVRVDLASGVQTVVAADAPLKGPYQVAAAPDGTLWSVQFGILSQRRYACVVRSRLSDGFSEAMAMFECSATGIAIRSDGTTLVGDCYRIHGDCGGDLYTQVYPSGNKLWGFAGPIAVVPELSTPTMQRTWGRLKAIYR